MRQPNFLLIMTDQHRADHLGCYGNSVLRTPHIDSLAQAGRRFDRFYANSPICMPNRIAMMTSRMPSTNGSRHNGIPLDLDAVTYVDLLRAAGYRTGLVGKGHLQNLSDRPLQPEAAARPDLAAPPEPLSETSRRRRLGPEYESETLARWLADPDREIALPYYGFDHVRLANGHGDRVHGHYDRWLLARGGDPARLTGPDNALPAPELVAPQAWRTALPEALYPTSFVAEESCAFLDHHAEDGGERPFFLQCSFPDPHHPFTPPGRYFDLYDPAQIPLPETFAEATRSGPAYLDELYRRAVKGRSHDRGPPPFAVTDPLAMRQMIALTYGMISMVDDAVGRILDRLNALSLRDNTVVIFTSDHGDFMGDHGLMLKHGIHAEGVLRVPFIWSDPARSAEETEPPLGCSIDLGPTILARAGLAPALGMQGIDLFGDPHETGLADRGGIMIEEDELAAHLGWNRGMRTRSFVTGRWRLTLYGGEPRGELYDRTADPQERHNLWDNPAHAVDRARLTEAMLRETIRLGDCAPRATHIA